MMMIMMMMIIIILIIIMKPHRPVKMCLNEICSKFHIDKHLYLTLDTLNVLKQGDVLWPLLFNFILEYLIDKDC
jgi:hypothetical protein